MGKGEGPEETGIFLVFSLTFGLVVYKLLGTDLNC